MRNAARMTDSVLAFAPVAGRVGGIYLSVATLALVYLGLYLGQRFSELTGGAATGRPSPAFEVLGFSFTTADPEFLLLGVPLNAPERTWYLFLVFTAIAFVLATGAVRSRPGRAWRAVRDNPASATAMGVDVSDPPAALARRRDDRWRRTLPSCLVVRQGEHRTLAMHVPDGDPAEVTLLLETGYSRRFELEADAVAARYAVARGWGTEPLERLLTRLSGDADAVPTFLSTHPATLERVKALRAPGDR